MTHDDIGGGKLQKQDSSRADQAPADRQQARCGAMMQQRSNGYDLQSSPQQFVRLVGGHRRAAPTERAPVRT